MAERQEFADRCEEILDKIQAVVDRWQDDPEALQELRQRVEALFDEELPIPGPAARERGWPMTPAWKRLAEGSG